jgi:hypothetical protein
MFLKKFLIFTLLFIALCSAVKVTNKGIGPGDDCIVWRANCISDCVNADNECLSLCGNVVNS